jgi:hypothetical protein
MSPRLPMGVETMYSTPGTSFICVDRKIKTRARRHDAPDPQSASPDRRVEAAATARP